MSDEDRDGMSQMDRASEGSITFGRNERGDLIIDGTIVEKNPHGVLYGPASEGLPAPEPDEVARLRAERDRLAAMYEDVEPLARIIDQPVMRQIVNEYVERGELEPPRAPAPAPEDVVGYQKRVAEPESAAILHQMREYASTLPEYQAQEINSNHKVWCRVYDRFKAAGAGEVPVPKQYAVPQTGYRSPEELRAAIERKRVNPGFVEGPGIPPQEYVGYEEDSRRAREKEFYKARARHRAAQEGGGTPVSRAQAEIDLVEKYFAIAEKKTPRRNELDGY